MYSEKDLMNLLQESADEFRKNYGLDNEFYTNKILMEKNFVERLIGKKITMKNWKMKFINGNEV